MKTIYKYPLKANSEGKQILSIPGGVWPLCVKLQDDKPVMWAVVDTDGPHQDWAWYVYYTGGDVRSDIHCSLYVGTTIQDELVCHYFIQPIINTPATLDNQPTHD